MMGNYDDESSDGIIYEYQKRFDYDGIDTATLIRRILRQSDELSAANARAEAAETENSQFVAALVAALGGDPSAVQNEALLVSAVALMRAEIVALCAQLAQYDLGDMNAELLIKAARSE